MSAPVLAIDFGTSNSAAAVLDGGRLRRIAIEDASDTLPTAVFFPTDRGPMRVGLAAGEALISGEEGRYMRALKSVLGTGLFHEDRLIGGRRRTLADIVAAFLAHVKQRAEAKLGCSVTRVLSGRPVHFYTADPARDARAEADLKGCYHAAGFDDVQFLYEPEAASHAQHARTKPGELGLVIDIGGGTSDFSVFRVTQGKTMVLASHGIRLGGTDFDHEVSMTHVMPLLGHGSKLTRVFGEGLLPVPNAIYRELATWAKIPFLYSRETERTVEDFLKHAVEPEKIALLGQVIKNHLGHELAFAVEKGKIAVNGQSPSAEIAMGLVKQGLSAPITTGSLNAALAGFGQKLQAAMYQTLIQAKVTPDQINAAVLVGGSSLMTLVRSEVQSVLPNTRLEQADAFTAVVDGLALATASFPLR